MMKRINTYKDLQQRKQQLQELLAAQKELLRQDVLDIKKELQPFSHAVSFVGKMATRDRSNPALAEGANVLIDVVVKKWLLSRSGWLARLALPFFAKNISSHVIADNKEEWLQKITDWFKDIFSTNKQDKKETEENNN